MKDYMNIHPGGSVAIVDWLGKDISKAFPRTPAADLPSKCLNTEKDLENFSQYQCVDMTDLDELLGLPCHKDVSKARLGVDKWFRDYKVGQLAFSGSSLQNDSNDWDWIVIQDRVYNVTNYVDGLRDENSGKVVKDPSESDNAYLSPSLHSLIVNKLNQDASEIYEKLYENDDYLDCLNDLFYVGVVDARGNDACRALNLTMYIMLVFVASMLCVQCLCSLLYLARPHRSFTAKDGESPVMVVVPW
jgi:chitin synthase